MPTPIVTQPIITTAGLIATRDAQGVAVRITHIGLGTASGYEPNKSQTALIAEKLRFPIAYTADVGMNFKQVTIDAIAEQGDPFFYGEIGFFMENGELFAVSSHLGDTAYLSDSISTTLTYSFGLSALPPDSVEFVIDSESAISYKLLEDHVNQYNPHPKAREALEINNAIAKSGQTVQTNIPNPSQLWNAISSARYKSVGTSTAGQTTTTGQIVTNNLNFTAHCDGFVILNAILNVTKESAGRYTNAVFVNSSSVASLGEAGTTVIQFGVACKKGTSYAFQQKVTVTTGGTASLVTIFSYSFFAGSI
jgi:hypothetical protein